jgi:hypothetical protein
MNFAFGSDLSRVVNVAETGWELEDYCPVVRDDV